jgi:hypothetical protein
MLLGYYQELLLDDLRRRRPFSFKGQLEMADDPIDGLRVFDEGDDTHLSSASRTQQRVYLIDFSDHLGPAFGRDMADLFLNDRRMEGRDSGLASLASVGIRIKTIVTDHHLTLVGNMRGDSGDKR